MEEDRIPMQNALPEGDKIPILFPRLPRRRRVRAFGALLLCVFLFAAAFGAGILLQSRTGFTLPFFEKAEKDGGQTPPTEGETSQREEGTKEPEQSPAPDAGETPKAEEDPIPAGALPILTRDFSGNAGSLHNLSVYSPNLDSPEPDVIGTSANGPRVLVLCTHGSECYSNGKYVEGRIGDAIYSEDPQDGVLAVGEALAAELSSLGVETIFCATRHDSPTLRSAYVRAAESIAFFLEQYPSITYVIDLHRDGLLSDDGSLIRAATTDENGEELAQLLLVVGSDGDGSPDYAWEENLTLARYIEERLGEVCPNLCRPTSLRNSPYNQNLVPRSLLLEVGAAGNTKEEALASASIFARVFSEYLLQ